MLSVVIPTKNEAETLPRLLSSLAQQTVRPNEIVVADADSTDGTRDIAREFGAIVVDGGLPPVGRNRGADAANGDLLLFLDADVVLHDDRYIERSISEMKQQALHIATSRVEPLSNKTLDRFLHRAYNGYVRMCGSFLPHAAGFCIFVQRDLHDAISGFDEEVVFCEDHDYARRAAKRGNFGILNTTIPVSVRRLDRDGRATIALKFALAELHLVTLGPIRHAKFSYTFGHGGEDI